MNEAALRDAVRRDMHHGQQALAAAVALRDLGMRNDALSRAYYAGFHLAAALLLTEGVEPRRHRAIETSRTSPGSQAAAAAAHRSRPYRARSVPGRAHAPVRDAAVAAATGVTWHQRASSLCISLGRGRARRARTLCVRLQ
jgi:hypothetical protein